jgi:NADH:ubiquinone oxidoreductase subunit 5 (subunit L)/multisubunit Na+/H+ antiporter MnhA subunit
MIIIKGYNLYWIIIINFLISFMSINLWSNNLNLYYTMLINNKYYPLSWFTVIAVILISPIVIFNSIDYLSIMDPYPFIFHTILPELSMINFILSINIIIGYFYWDSSGSISHLPINFRSNKVNCGIKAVIYNKIGDNFSLSLSIIIYPLLSFINYYLSVSLCIILSFIYLVYIYSIYLFIPNSLFILFPLSLFFILYSKSAQLPFSTWPSNATPAPTPISPLSHSSTMVIAGVLRYYY